MSNVNLSWIKDIISQYEKQQVNSALLTDDTIQVTEFYSKAEAADEILDLIKNYIKEINNVTNKPIEIKK